MTIPAAAEGATATKIQSFKSTRVATNRLSKRDHEILSKSSPDVPKSSKSQLKVGLESAEAEMVFASTGLYH